MTFKYSKACALLTIALAAAISPHAFSTTLTVTSLADSGPGTLRDRIAAALPGDNIQFSVLGTMTLNSELVISKNLRIDGGSASSQKISGNNHSRIFNVTSGTAQIFNLTIADGRVNGATGSTGSNGENVFGGGIRVATGATLDLETCILSNNVAVGGQGGSDANGGNGYGGGLASFGSLTMVRCTVTGNSGSGGLGGAPAPGLGGQGSGGGLYLEGSANIFYSSIYANNAVAGSGGTGPGGAVGGGIYNLATLNVATCTIVSNTATGSSVDSGGGVANYATSTIRDSTIVGNQADIGGGVLGGSIGNTLLAGNSAASGPDGSGPVLSNDYNLIQNTNGMDLSGTTTHNITGQDPLLGPLQYNGGPDISHTMLTMAPLPGSPAIDNGKTSGSIDQRTFTRPYDTEIPNASGGNGADIGAIEVHPTSLYATNNNDSGPGSLRQAILDNNGLGGSNPIYFSSNVVGTITLTSGPLVMNVAGQVFGPGPNVLAVSGNHNGRVFDSRSGPTTISGLTIRDGLVIGATGAPGQTGFDERGAGIYTQGTLLVSNCVVISNTVIGGTGGNANFGSGGNGGKGLGGGLYNAGANFTLVNCTFDGNTTTGGLGGTSAASGGGFGGNGLGGAVCSIGDGNVSILACEFKNDVAKGGDGVVGDPTGVGGQGYGGGIYSESIVAVSGSTIAGNSAIGGGSGIGGGPGSGSGGGGYSITTWTFTNSTIANNTATGGSFNFGGGLNSQGTLSMFNCTITGNQADYGGAMNASPTLGNTILAGNTTTTGGPDVTGSIFSEDYNLIQKTNGLAISGPTLHMIIGVDPLLEPLANNGGPTRTCALRSGSPAIDKGKNKGPATDQRGAPRSFDFASIPNAGGGDASDIGAFELASPTLTLQRFGTSAVLTWPSYYADFTLQSATDLFPQGSWANVPGTPPIVASQFVVTNGPISGKRFFRLKSN
jgi:hypothetical protein